MTHGDINAGHCEQHNDYNYVASKITMLVPQRIVRTTATRRRQMINEDNCQIS